jgi:hypothetical protein
MVDDARRRICRTGAGVFVSRRPVGSKFGRGLERATGISEARIEPVLIANETARLTVGQNITTVEAGIPRTCRQQRSIWVAGIITALPAARRARAGRRDATASTSVTMCDLGTPALRRDVRRRPTMTSLAVSVDAGSMKPGSGAVRESGDAYEYF